MWRSFLRASMLIVMVVLCVGVPIVNAEGFLLNWTSPTTAILWDVHMISANDGWAVGWDDTIIHWDGTNWNNIPCPTTVHPHSVDMISASDGWAVGNSVIHWDGSSWSNVTSPAGGLSIDMISANDGWIVGVGGTLHWDGTSWSRVTIPLWSLYSVCMVSANDVWAVGQSGGVGSPGIIVHWDGTSWSEVTSPTTEPLSSVCMVSANDGWAVGYGGIIFQWTGTAWVPEFPTIILVPLLISLTLVTAIMAKTASKKHRERSMLSQTQP